ncbi:MAG TPA: carboxypeptidase-like regulatory domain-containing protein, partial [Chryseolinea sp.]|nr:carboxypeptidase-like regulatory domain-containing protein [Chryseolinea sp.]
MKQIVILYIILLTTGIVSAQSVLKGRVYDNSGKPLDHAHVHFSNPNKTVTTEAGGDFTATLPSGKVRLAISYTGFRKLSQEFILKGDTSISFFLEPSIEQLDEVVISGNRFLQSDQFESTRTSTFHLTEKEINSIPVLGGEADLIKTIQLLPGV